MTNNPNDAGLVHFSEAIIHLQSNFTQAPVEKYLKDMEPTQAPTDSRIFHMELRSATKLSTCGAAITKEGKSPELLRTFCLHHVGSPMGEMVSQTHTHTHTHTHIRRDSASPSGSFVFLEAHLHLTADVCFCFCFGVSGASEPNMHLSIGLTNIIRSHSVSVFSVPTLLPS